MFTYLTYLKSLKKQKTARAVWIIYLKLTIKDTRTTNDILLALYSTVDIAVFEQVNASWVRETIVSNNKFVSSNCN